MRYPAGVPLLPPSTSSLAFPGTHPGARSVGVRSHDTSKSQLSGSPGALFTPSLMVVATGGNPSVSADATVVRGRVTYHGRPVSDTGIVFLASDGSSRHFAAAPISGDGSFAVRLFRGRYEIFLLPLPPPTRSGASELPGANGRATPEIPDSPRGDQFPPRFGDRKTSPLSVTIGDRDYLIEIDLRD